MSRHDAFAGLVTGRSGSAWIEKAIRFADWCDSRSSGTPPTPREVMAHFGVHRATAYRWIDGYKAARGMA